MPSISERLKPFIGTGDLSTSAYEYKFKKKTLWNSCAYYIDRLAYFNIVE